MSRFSPGSPPVTTLAAAITGAATSLTVPSGSHAAMDGPERVILGSIELVDVLSVAAGSPETWTVARGVDTTAAQPHDVGTVVERVYTLDEVIYHPQAITTNVPTGNSVTYTPDAGIKYHFLQLGGSTKLTINAPTGVNVQPGQELRLLFIIGGTALSTQPAFAGAYWRSPAFSASLTANTASSISFTYRGGGLSATNAWVRIN